MLCARDREPGAARRAARANLAAAGLSGAVTVAGSALEMLPELPELANHSSFDAVFVDAVDADKVHYDPLWPVGAREPASLRTRDRRQRLPVPRAHDGQARGTRDARVPRARSQDLRLSVRLHPTAWWSRRVAIARWPILRASHGAAQTRALGTSSPISRDVTARITSTGASLRTVAERVTSGHGIAPCPRRSGTRTSSSAQDRPDACFGAHADARPRASNRRGT